MSVKLIWITPEAEKNIMYCARVSNPENQDSEDSRLLKYCMKHGHWSVFEMANMCVEITTSRAISPQILRHRSFSFQEFSQRYAEATTFENQKPRRQDTKNRQNSIDDLSDEVKNWWEVQTLGLISIANNLYKQAINKGVAKECARAILPLNTTTKLYMNGTVRSWIHYLNLRCDKSTQLEHREIAEQIKAIIQNELPVIGELL